MNSEKYKKICSQPNVIDRNTIHKTLRALRGEEHGVIKELEGVLKKPPVDKPPKHKDGPHTDFFIIELKQETIEKIVEALFDKEAGAVGIDGETTPEASSFATLVDCWSAILRKSY